MLSKVMVDTIYCSVLHEGKVAACASAAIEHGYALIQNVIVKEDMRGLGLGKKLCSALIAKAKEEGPDMHIFRCFKIMRLLISFMKNLVLQRLMATGI